MFLDGERTDESGRCQKHEVFCELPNQEALVDFIVIPHNSLMIDIRMLRCEF